MRKEKTDENEYHKNHKNPMIRYTVELNTLSEGTITTDEEGIEVNQYHENVQFVDAFGNKMGVSGRIERIIKKEEICN